MSWAKEEIMRYSPVRIIVFVSISMLFALMLSMPAHAEEQQPIKIGIITFLSGPAAGPFGVTARNGAVLMADKLNAGKVPGQYSAVGFGGTPIELVVVDEAGGSTKQVSVFHNLV